MSDVQQRSVMLPVKIIQFINAKIASGAYSSASTVVQESLELLQQENADSDEWIRTEVLPALAEYDADRSTGLTLDQMRMALAGDDEEECPALTSSSFRPKACAICASCEET